MDVARVSLMGDPNSAVVLERNRTDAGLGAGKIRVGMVAPVPRYLNPYISLMLNSLEQTGAVEHVLQLGFSPRWFFENWRQLDVLHIHWLEYAYTGESTARTYRKLILFIAALAWCHARGIEIVYTVHNLEPHSPQSRVPLLVASRSIFTIADAIHVHEESTRAAVAARFGRTRGIHVIPHGNYVGAYPNECSLTGARQALNLDDSSFVYLFLGQIRPNKGAEDLIRAFSQLEDASARLVIAGWAPDGAYGDLIARLASADNRISLHLAFISDDALQYYFNASDVCVLPYRRFTTSGATLLALSFGCPVIGPDVGSFADILGDGSGLLYDAHDPVALGKALLSARETLAEHGREKALQRAHDFDWAPIGAQHVALYRSLCGRS